MNQSRAPEDNTDCGSRDESGADSSTMKRKYTDREPESPGQMDAEEDFAAPELKKERNYYESGDSPASYPKHVIVPASEKQNRDAFEPNVTHSPEEQRLSQAAYSSAPEKDGMGAPILTPDSINRARPSQSYDSQPIDYNRQPPYHDVYRTPSYNPDMDYGRSPYSAPPPPAAHGGHPPPRDGENFVRTRRWACDVCNVATFLSYEEACAHEEICSRRYHESQQYHDHRSASRPPPYPGSRGSGMQPNGSGLGALYHASQEVVTPPTPHRHPSSRWGNHGPPLPVFPHEQSYPYRGFDMRDDPAQHYYEQPHHYHQPPPPPPAYAAPPVAPHHHSHHGPSDYYQKRVLLAMPSDRDSLSDRQCYVRSEMVEIFAATEKDVTARHSKGAQKLIQGQVGIRCVHCSHLRPRDRAERAVCYPSSISRIYQTVADMQRFHFEQCREIPEHVRQIYKKLKTTRPRGVGSPQTYWMSSAKNLGLVDTENGIRFDVDPVSSEMAMGPN